MALDTTTSTIEKTKQTNFVTELQRQMSNLLQSYQRCKKLRSIWNDRLWGDSQTYQITNTECSHVNVSATEVVNAITAIAQFENFLENQSVTTGDYLASINPFQVPD